MSELVSKTSSAVAVDEDLTTLLDWVNIEGLSGFTIIVTNAGGGSANDITDVQTDTSDDGGATSSLDQHAGVPAVPIADGESKQDTFTETSKFVRVRALCAAGEDTTAEAVLLADSATGRLCTLANVKDRLGINDTDHDTNLVTIIDNLLSVFENHCLRKLILNAADVTEYYTGCGRYIQLDRYPIVSVTSIKQALDYDFDNATALTANTDYRQVREGKNGILYRMHQDWYNTEDCIQVIYTGGYCSAGQTPGSGEHALPEDLVEAAILQSSFIFKRRNDIGLASVSFEGGAISKSEPVRLLPMVKDILKDFKKPGI